MTAPLTPVPDPVLFPFEPDANSDLVEVWTYHTNILTARTGRERRIRTARVPMVTLRWQVSALTEESSALVGGLWNTVQNRWNVPRWPSARPIRAPGEAGGVYPVDLVATDFVVGAGALVWRGSGMADVMTVEAVGLDTLTLSGIKTFLHAPGSMVVPLLPGSLTAFPSVARADRVAQLGVEFRCDVRNQPLPVMGEAPYTFKGVEILPEWWTTGMPQEQWAARQDGVGGAAFVSRTLDTYVAITTSMTWVAASRADLAALRQFIARRAGAWAPCWVPTLAADWHTTAPVAAGARTLPVADTFPYAADPARRYGAVYAGGQLTPFTVASWDDVSIATIEALPTLPAGATVMILRYCRLAQDVLELVIYPGLSSGSCALQFVELPLETPV